MQNCLMKWTIEMTSNVIVVEHNKINVINAGADSGGSLSLLFSTRLLH